MNFSIPESLGAQSRERQSLCPATLRRKRSFVWEAVTGLVQRAARRIPCGSGTVVKQDASFLRSPRCVKWCTPSRRDEALSTGSISSSRLAR